MYYPISGGSDMEKYTKEVLEEAVKNSESFAGVLRYLGLKQAGGTQSYIVKKIKKFNIPTVHFNGTCHRRNKPASNKRHFKEILVLRVSFHKEHAQPLRRAMIESGIEYSCKICGIKDWNKKDITLEIHHLDGNNMNNVKSNLEFHCPNCHSQTSSYNKRK